MFWIKGWRILYRHDLDFLKILKKTKLQLNSNFKVELYVILNIILNFYMTYCSLFIYITIEASSNHSSFRLIQPQKCLTYTINLLTETWISYKKPLALQLSNRNFWYSVYSWARGVNVLPLQCHQTIISV